MFGNIPPEIKLWRHQREALAFLIGHLRGSNDPCLLRMPTGTGKTGVVACASLISASGRTLVLTPWANLRDQMISALTKGFWESIGLEPPPYKIVELMPSSAKDVLKSGETKVIVSTFTALTELRRDDKETYDMLAAFVDMVVVDECHYEPALEWGKAVKGLRRPTVLLTATPYRNDLKLFRIRSASASVFQFTHRSAQDDGIIRGLVFEPLADSPDVAALAQTFITAWKAAIANRKLASTSPRAIICCANSTEIKEVVTHLRDAGLTAIGIHEAFEKSKSVNFVKDVPAISNAADIWVHQNKLTEGLDDHRFCCLAFFSPVNNDRKLVQQIGRVLRTHATDRAGVPALVLAPSHFKLEERWLAYREFEQDADLQSAEHYRRVVERLLDGQPSVEYFDGRFRRRFRPDALPDDPQVAIAPSVLVRVVQKSFTFDDYVEDCTDSLNLTDAIILGKPDAPCQRSGTFALWVYASVANSRLLEETSLYEVKLEAHCAVLAGDYLLISDTTGTYPEALLDGFTSGLGAADLSRLMDPSYRVTNVATSSAVPFDTVLRASEHRGHDLASIPSSLTDRVQICRAARGASPTGRRYIGLHRGRVREELPERLRRQHSVSTFRAWAETIADGLAAMKSSHPVLQRYMQTCSPPSAPVPVSMAIDLSHPKLKLSAPDGAVLLISASSVVVQAKTGSSTAGAYECTFVFLKGGDPKHPLKLDISIDYQHNRGRFWFRSRGAPGIHVQEVDDVRSTRRSLPDFLNQNQELVLLGLKGGSLVYQGKNFYAVDYTHAERTLLEHFDRPAIAACSNEKGTSEELDLAKAPGSKAKAFIPGSLFKVIAEGVLPLPFVPDLVICDDLGSECADFVMANFPSRSLALVHAKAGDGAGISASAFHDLVAQAMKNLVYLSRNAEQPEGVKSWKKDAHWNGTGIPRLYKAPANCPSGTELWKRLREDIVDSADAQLYVVLATTGCCDLSALKGAIHDSNKRTPETAQLFHLLDGLIGYARQLGVRISVVDVPYAKKPAALKKKAKAQA